MAELDATPETAGRTGGSTIALFLGLYLLVLAFFILLVSISTPEKVKSRAVMDSLSSTFASILPPAAEMTVFTAKQGGLASSRAFQTEVSKIFSTAMRVAKVDIVVPGRLMRIVMPSDAMFRPGEAAVREGRYDMLDRIVASLSSPAAGMRHDLDLVVGASPGPGGLLPTEPTLETRRAGAFATQMLSRGAPAQAISIGIQPGEPADLVIWFHSRFEDEARTPDANPGSAGGT